MTLRQKYNPIIMKLEGRIDEACRRFIEGENIDDLWEYEMLIMEMEEIKNAIIAEEKENT